MLAAKHSCKGETGIVDLLLQKKANIEANDGVRTSRRTTTSARQYGN
jgi:hypothetical protein